MTKRSQVLSIHPYFQIHEGKIDEVKAILRELVAATATEDACLYYDFSIGDGVLYCREAYVGAAGALAHAANVGPILERMLQISDLIRFELHGAAEELDQLREPFAPFNPTCFEFEVGLER